MTFFTIWFAGCVVYCVVYHDAQEKKANVQHLYQKMCGVIILKMFKVLKSNLTVAEINKAAQDALRQRRKENASNLLFLKPSRFSVYQRKKKK